MELQHARYLAESVVAKLAPYCLQCQIVGSVRRQQKEVTDIDILVSPQRDQVKDLFGKVTESVVVPEFIQLVNSWERLKGNPTGKYCQRIIDGHKVEIYIATEETWAALQIIRTGSSDFTHMLMTRAMKLGFKQQDGILWRDEKPIPMKDEVDYFRVLNLPYIEPSKRDINAFR